MLLVLQLEVFRPQRVKLQSSGHRGKRAPHMPQPRWIASALAFIKGYIQSYEVDDVH